MQNSEQNNCHGVFIGKVAYKQLTKFTDQKAP